MKIQKLTIHNIASIEDAVIDFEANPLSSSEVFLITGKTGAGKSTILDAICLALFANTPRLENTNMQGDLQDGEVDVKIDDPRQLMRKNTSEAYAQLTFTGNNGSHYEATWSVKRARNKVDGKIQGKNWQLVNLDTKFTFTRDKEITLEINNAVGLDFNQFCRTTLLAQGEFTRFLNSEDKDKAEILEKITGVAVYSKIGAKVYAVTKEKEKARDIAQQLVENTHVLSDNDLQNKQIDLANLDAQYVKTKADCDADTTKHNWLKKETELAQLKISAEAELKESKAVINSHEFKEKEQFIKDWNTTIDVRQWMKNVQEAKETEAAQKSKLCDLISEYSRLLGGYAYLERGIQNYDSKISDIKNFIDSESDNSSVYENTQTIVGELQKIYDGRKVIEDNEKKIALENTLLNDTLLPDLKNAQNAEAIAKESLHNDEKELRSKEEVVAKLNLQQLRQDSRICGEQLGNIKIAKDRLEILASAKNQREKTRIDLSKKEDYIKQLNDKSLTFDNPIKTAAAVMESCKSNLEKQRDSIDKFTKALRSKLKKGATCPVCGQLIESELPHEDVLEQLVGELQESFDDAEKKYNGLVAEKNKIESDIKSEMKSYNNDLTAFKEDNSVQNAEQKAIEACKVCKIDTVDDSTVTLLEDLEGEIKKNQADLNLKIDDGEEKENAVKNLRKVLDEKRKSVETSVNNVRSAEKKVDESNRKIETFKALTQSKKTDVESASKKAEKLITGAWNIDWKVSPIEFSNSLKSASQKYNESVRQKQELEAHLSVSKAEKKSLDTVIASIWNSQPEWKAIVASSIHMVPNLLQKFNEVDNNVNSARKELESADNRIKLNNKQIDEFISVNPSLDIDRLKSLSLYSAESIERQSKSLKAHNDKVVEKNTLFEKAVKDHEEHSLNKPNLAEDETLESLQTRIDGYADTLEILSQNKGAIEKEIQVDNDNKIRLGCLLKDAQKKNVEYNQWCRLNELLGDSTGSKFRKIAQSYVLASLIHSANYYMSTLTDRYTLEVKPGSFVITIRDAYQGYVSRAASTISGGEGFLVSLSLALALSDIGQKMSVDTLFIDEGFGTLSGEPLQNAVNTLRTLHTKAGRHVGIISHVEELQERIPVQIHVHQENNNSSSRVTIVSK